MTLATGDLTTLSAAQPYLDSPPSAAVLNGMITRVSRSICSYLNRGLLIPHTYTEQFSGSGTHQLVLPNYPILTLDSLKISGRATEPAQHTSELNTFSNPYGYRYQPWNGIPPGIAPVIELTGGAFYMWSHQGVVVTYRAGYQVTDESIIVPSFPGKECTVTPMCPFGVWATDEGVRDAIDGTLYLAVQSTETPLVGQYIPPDPNQTPQPRLYYTFCPDDGQKTLLISYGYVPAELEQAALETVQDRASYRRRAGGVRSQSLAAQESITYAQSDGFSDYVKDILGPFCSPLPPAMGVFV